MSSLKFFFFVFIVFGSLSHSVLGQDALFRRVQLAHGISLEIPSHWTILSLDNRKNIQAAGKAITENTGLEGSTSRKESLLAVNAKPNPTGAMIRVSVTLPSDYMQSDLAVLEEKDLKRIGAEMYSAFRKLEASGGPKIIEMQSVYIEKSNNYRVLVIPYVRAGVNGSSTWQVTQYKIPIANRLIEITLSYRQSDAIVWRPILEKVYRSIQF